MSTLLADFHFLRPWFLLLIPAAWLLYRWAAQSQHSANNWQSVIDASLLKHLLRQQGTTAAQRYLLPLLAGGWIIACVAAAGPAWQKVPQPVSKQQDVLVIVLDLSLSMYAEDEKPSRLVRARRKIHDILQQRKEGLTALITYSGDAHLVVPLTDDSNTIINLLDAMEPSIMPSFGSNIRAALTLVQQQLDSSNTRDARILLLTDELSETGFEEGLAQLQQPSQLSIITFGTRDGAPIPLPNGFLKTRQGDTVLAKLNDGPIQKMAASQGISVSHNRIDNRDIQRFIKPQSQQQQQEQQRHSDIWQDNGHWLVLLLIPLMLLCFRRGWILLLLIMVLPEDSYALSWQALWQNNNQQGEAALQRKDYNAAAEHFDDPDWKAYSHYKAGEYNKAASLFSNRTATSLYNKGNALTQLGRFEDAIKTYEEALKKQPDFDDAKTNKALAEALLEQQKKQEQEQQDSQDQQSGSDGEDQPSQQDQQGQKNSNNPDDSPSSQQQNNPQQGSPDSQQPSDPSQNELSQQSGEKTDDDPDNQQPDSPQDDTTDKPLDDNTGISEAEENNTPESEDSAAMPAQQLSPEEQQRQQALQQWLRSVPDDPGQLLRNKFRYQYEQNLRRQQHIDQESDHVW